MQIKVTFAVSEDSVIAVIRAGKSRIQRTTYGLAAMSCVILRILETHEAFKTVSTELKNEILGELTWLFVNRAEAAVVSVFLDADDGRYTSMREITYRGVNDSL